MGCACRADVAPVQDKPVVRHGKQVVRDVLLELQFGLQGRAGPAREPYARRDAEDMRIDRHHLLVPDDRPHDVGRLAAHTRQTLQRLEVARDLAPELRAEHPRHGGEAARLVVGVGDAAYVGVYIFGRSRGQSLRRRVGREECRRGHVDALVGALRREHHRHQKLVGILIVQLALGRRHVGREPLYDAVVSLFEGHARRYKVQIRTNVTNFFVIVAPEPHTPSPDTPVRTLCDSFDALCDAFRRGVYLFREDGMPPARSMNTTATHCPVSGSGCGGRMSEYGGWVVRACAAWRSGPEGSSRRRSRSRQRSCGRW